MYKTARFFALIFLVWYLIESFTHPLTGSAETVLFLYVGLLFLTITIIAVWQEEKWTHKVGYFMLGLLTFTLPLSAGIYNLMSM
ncbi:hypothetical protein [Alkalicoccobacillus plakortidis]|uniref:Uncharacterized protein n=1 Tax=Alkalicoccobacillus plakortidis TaxID=444060 RepID=A0ABT0XH49_9BACI|nr:hypothetical protein [Alkalicoccobacillus plakortidis]MCM2674653.1 hypothetical protein [Alkalicoccobacillus plakortidis]